MRTEEWEYGYLHMLLMEGLPEKLAPTQPGWFGVAEYAIGSEIVKGKGLLGIMNGLGADGWIIGEPQEVEVKNNDVPQILLDALQNYFRRSGIIRKHRRRAMSRRIPEPDVVYDDDEEDDADE